MRDIEERKDVRNVIMRISDCVRKKSENERVGAKGGENVRQLEKVRRTESERVCKRDKERQRQGQREGG